MGLGLDNNLVIKLSFAKKYLFSIPQLVLLLWFPFLKNKHLGYNCIQTVHLGRYIIGYMVGNLVLWLRLIPILIRLCNCVSNWSIASHRKLHCDIINKVKLFATVYRRIYWRKFSTLTIRCRVTKGSALEYAMTS